MDFNKKKKYIKNEINIVCKFDIFLENFSFKNEIKM